MSPIDAGTVAQQAGVKLPVLGHLVPSDADRAFLERARKTHLSS